MRLLSPKEAAALKNVSVASIYAAIKYGTIVKYDENSIDVDDPKNVVYFATPKGRHLLDNKYADVNSNEVNGRSDFEDFLDYCDECKEDGEKPESFEIWKQGRKQEKKILESINEYDVKKLGIDKIKMDMEYKASQKLQKDLANAEKLGAIIDIHTLEKKFGALRDVLSNELIPMPRNIVEILWSEAQESEDPELTIVTILEDRISEILKRIIQIIQDIEPEDGSIEYTLYKN